MLYTRGIFPRLCISHGFFQILVIFTVLYADFYPSVLWHPDYYKEFKSANEHKLAECPHPFCRRCKKQHFPKGKIRVPYRPWKVNGTYMLAAGEPMLKTDSSIHKKPFIKETKVQHFQAHWRWYRYFSLSVPCRLGPQGCFCIKASYRD